jgi:hypothetical protein
MGIQKGFLVLERGFGEDADEAIRKEISQTSMRIPKKLSTQSSRGGAKMTVIS